MGKKYIIDLNPDCVEGEYLRIPARIAGEEQWLVTKAALTPYTEPDLEKVRKEAYDKGYDDATEEIGSDEQTIADKAYQKGLSDAWEAARKIQDTGGNLNWWIHNTSAFEAIEKIRQYEREKEEIKVGDEVIATSGKAVIVSINDNKDRARYIYPDSTLGFDNICNLSKTGRHFPEVSEVLEKIREE